MVFSMAADAPIEAPDISPTADAAKALVTRLVMQAVTDVLFQQGRAAFLPDAVISTILDQLTIQVNYEPLQCNMVFAPKMPDAMLQAAAMVPTCVVVGNTVTSMCVLNMNCQINMAAQLMRIDSKHLSISGSIRTTNIIMANWNRDMWQSVVNKAIRMLTSGPLATHFFSATATVS
ncbi:hypothetical protein KIN20_017060 [Parelaphostrongylus tenuis]|uniref:Uncharacterized protein n=1 Tax=Parelaphostrongylus tenuis TaxID=148309 RepID=A0AAD5MHD7_PARTN|nr:hypothetical protein KIN20_017060 [Parelaphostrongylus tenuis]